MVDALVVTPSFLPGRGGIETYLAELCAALAPRLAVLAPARRDGRGIPELPYPVEGYDGRMWSPGPRLRAAVRDVAARHETSRVIFGTPWPVVFAGPHLRRAGLSYAVIVHGAEFLVPARLPALAGRLAGALGAADLLLPVSDYTGNALRSFLERRGVAVPPIVTLRARVDVERFRPGIDTSRLRARLCLDDDVKLVLCFGRLVKRKGIDRLIAALPHVAASAGSVALVIAGTGPEDKRLRRLAAHTAGTVIFTGRVPDEDAPAYYCLADVFALPVADRWWGLESEGLGVVLLEAAACGTPCVTGRSGGTREAVSDHESGFVIDGRDTRAVARSIVWLLEHPREAEEMGRAGRRHVVKQFSGDIPAAFSRWLQDRPTATATP